MGSNSASAPPSTVRLARYRAPDPQQMRHTRWTNCYLRSSCDPGNQSRCAHHGDEFWSRRLRHCGLACGHRRQRTEPVRCTDAVALYASDLRRKCAPRHLLSEIVAQCTVRVREATQALAASPSRARDPAHPVQPSGDHWATTVDNHHVPVLPLPPASL